MNSGYKIALFAGIAALGLSVAGVASANDDSAHSQRKTGAKKTQPLPPLPSGPTGPVPQIPLDTMTPVPPQVSYQNGQLTIVAPNSTLGDILRAVRKQTGAEIEIPTANDRVVTHLGPGPAQEVMADLLNGSRFNYVLLGSPTNAGVLTRVVLVAKSGGAAEVAIAGNQPTPPQPVMNQVANVNPQEATDTADADAPDDNADDNSDQAAQAEQPAAAPTDQPEVKTPQQMLQEMQQRQLQLQQQQQQQAGQPPAPGAVMPQRPPQDQQ
jgi:hypothetical protein